MVILSNGFLIRIFLGIALRQVSLSLTYLNIIKKWVSRQFLGDHEH